MIIRDENVPYAFIHNPRTSGTSITEYLINYCGGRRLRNVPEYVQEHSIYAEESRYRNFDSHYVFGFVRNPWSREWTLHKLYCRDTGNSVDFKSWLMHDFPWYRQPQYGMYCDLAGKLKTNIFRFEDRSNAIKQISDIIKTDSEQFESYNVNNGFNTGMKYVKDYDQEMIDCVAERYSLDIEAFGYYFDGYDDVIKDVPFTHTDTMTYNIVQPKIRYVNV